MTEDNSGLFDDSRRSFMKKGAVATTALALGAGATGTATAQADGSVLVYGDDYKPGQDFTVISALNTQTKEDLLAESGSEDDVFDDPDDWDAYIISYDLGVDAPTWGFLFTEEVSLSAGDSETMGDDGEFRDSQLDLIEVTPGATGNGGDTENGNGDGEDGDMEDGDGAMEDGNGGAGGNESEDGAGGGGGGGGGN
ncbi:twin-arginine translocation signal domain-containing protein [Haloarchaeobius amylolyticus]|uniref:Twin-arginine translocation signal domain-containing protein n=1 Tax=Haloarchaeobius amylolyticus TaxID=1198296 RepID=A0ABD6BHW3_9EURY